MRQNCGHSVLLNISVSSEPARRRTGPGSRTRGIYMLKKNKKKTVWWGIVGVWRRSCVSVSQHMPWRSFGATPEPWRTSTLLFCAGPRSHCTALRYPPTPDHVHLSSVVLLFVITSVLCCRSSRLGDCCITDQITWYQSRLRLFTLFRLNFFPPFFVQNGPHCVRLTLQL